MNIDEKLIRDLCRQDENVGGITYTEDEIQNFLNDKSPYIARMISGSIKTWRLENEKENENCN